MPDRKADKNWGPKATSRPRRAPPSRAIRRSLVLRESVAGALESDFRSRLVESIREHGNVLEIGQTRIALATEFGFCYGVDRAVELAYDTVKRFPDRRIFITAEIIHNPWVNRLLRGMGVRFLTSGLSAGDTFEGIRAEDVVILPAFGASVETRRLLEGRGCLIVDTTCGSVIRVWKRVERDAADGFTSVIHGTYTHEETIATASAATAAGGRFLIVRDAEEARAVCAMIEGRSDAGEFARRFAGRASAGFDARRDLRRIGLANQTTMLSSESLAIGEMIRASLERRYGQERVAEHFRAFDTICTATQDRQNAVRRLAEARPELALVIGGFNSSNTGHLREIASRFTRAYHIEGPDCLISAKEIRHKPNRQSEPVIERDWLPAGRLTIGVTAGASTPNRVTGEVVERLLALREEKN